MYLLEKDLNNVLITFLKRLQKLRQESMQKMKQKWQKSLTGTMQQTDGKNLVWFGEIEKKLAKLSKTTFAYRSSS